MIPRNELGVLILFAQQAQDAGFEILAVQSAFPDLFVKKDDTTYRAEVEFVSSNFIKHNHDIRECDIIICWENDQGLMLPTLELSNPDWRRTELIVPPRPEINAFYWKQRALKAERKLGQLQAQEIDDKYRSSKSSNMKTLLELLQSKPHMSIVDIADFVGVSRQSIYSYLTELESDGLIEKTNEGIVVK